jgi:hypothetical protein
MANDKRFWNDPPYKQAHQKFMHSLCFYGELHEVEVGQQAYGPYC